jgi:Translation initiation factor 1 (eIF-1/SUI1) and related proteins
MATKKNTNTGGIVYSTDADFNFSNQKNDVESLPPAEQLLKIKLDKKHRGGKVVTLIDGFSMNEEEIEILSKQLKTFCGAGGSAKDFEIIIQGDHRDKILQWLIKKGFLKAKKV